MSTNYHGYRTSCYASTRRPCLLPVCPIVIESNLLHLSTKRVARDKKNKFFHYFSQFKDDSGLTTSIVSYVTKGHKVIVK